MRNFLNYRFLGTCFLTAYLFTAPAYSGGHVYAAERKTAAKKESYETRMTKRTWDKIMQTSGMPDNALQLATGIFVYGLACELGGRKDYSSASEEDMQRALKALHETEEYALDKYFGNRNGKIEPGEKDEFNAAKETDPRLKTLKKLSEDR
jgi:hypothetical protein